MKFHSSLLSLTIALSLAISSSLAAKELSVGDDAPNFSLKATNGKTYTLANYKGRQAVVLAWYPMANTRGCTIECLSLVNDGHLIRQYDVSYFMASVDPLEDNLDFAKKTKADFPMLSDPTKSAAKAFDVLSFLGFAKRWTFYIGINGKILKIDKDIEPKSAAKDMVDNLKLLGFTPR
ncbi:peroxiredoxin family protein [Psychrobium sp. nBUS_13]|uniref:peroxiredoxin family protein n=1 Tax=Psychrobium sp. nBUS_13 TaxID=3395319 RepID=UPI003EBF62F9